MKRYYIAGFVPEEDGGYSVFFPDLPRCGTCADTLEEATEMAEDVLSLMLHQRLEDGEAIPAPSSLEEVRAKLAEHLERLGEPLPETTLYQLVAAPAPDMSPVRVNVSFPRAVLERIDQKARRGGYTRSGFLARAAEAYQPEKG